jgi:hypothetical protein
MIMTATIKRIATRWTLPALVLIAGGFVCDGLTEVGHHAFLIAGGMALGIGIGRESRPRLPHDSEIHFNVIEAVRLTNQCRSSNPTTEIQSV